MGPLSYMQSVVDQNVVVRRIPQCCARHKLLPHDVAVYIVPGRNIVSSRLTVQVRYGTDTVPAFPWVFHYTTHKLFHIFLSVQWYQGSVVARWKRVGYGGQCPVNCYIAARRCTLGLTQVVESRTRNILTTGRPSSDTSIYLKLQKICVVSV
jgi:hypothetical protein